MHICVVYTFCPYSSSMSLFYPPFPSLPSAPLPSLRMQPPSAISKNVQIGKIVTITNSSSVLGCTHILFPLSNVNSGQWRRGGGRCRRHAIVTDGREGRIQLYKPDQKSFVHARANAPYCGITKYTHYLYI